MIADDQDSPVASSQAELSVWTELDRSASTALIFPFAHDTGAHGGAGASLEEESSPLS